MSEQTTEGRVPKVHLREEVASAARMMEIGMRSKDPLIRSGDWLHWKLMPLSELLASLERNRTELAAMATSPEGPGGQKARRKAADLANIANFVALRIAKGDRAE